MCSSLGRLVLNGGDHFRVAVPGVGDRDAGGEVEEQVAVHVLDDAPASGVHEQRVHGGVRRRHEPLVAGEQLGTVRARERRADVRHREVIELEHDKTSEIGRGMPADEGRG
jgi:hypothetical protein